MVNRWHFQYIKWHRENENGAFSLPRFEATFATREIVRCIGVHRLRHSVQAPGPVSWYLRVTQHAHQSGDRQAGRQPSSQATSQLAKPAASQPAKLSINHHSPNHRRHCAPRLPRPNPGKTALFFEFSLCLSRACLGKIMHFIYKWLKKCRFLASHASFQPHPR